MANILITGASGNLGSGIINHLLENTKAENIAALVRDEEKAKLFKEKGIDVRIGNYDDTTSLDQALKGIEKLVLISGTDPAIRLQQHKNVIDAAKKTGVKHILYTGVSMENLETSANSFLMQSHFQTEDYIKESGLGYSFLRDNLYFDTIPMFIGESIPENGLVALPTGNGKVAFALRREIAEAIANILLRENEGNKVYHITGTEAYSYADIVSELANLSGKAITYEPVEQEAYINQLKSFGVPEVVINILVSFAADIKANQHAIVYQDLKDLLGREPATLHTASKEFYNL